MAYAQDPNEAEGEEDPIITAPSGRLNLTLKQAGYESRTLNRDRASFNYRLDLPGNFQISPTGNYLDLITSHFVTTQKPSALKVNTNNQIIATIPLSTINAISNTTRVGLPEQLLKKGRNSIVIDLNMDTDCRDEGGFVEVTVDQNSIISFEYQQNPYPTDLGLYPFPFVEASLLDIPVAVVLPDQPSAAELTAAATVAAGLGQKSSGTINITTVLASQITPEIQNNHHLIVIGKSCNIAVMDTLELPLPIDNNPVVKSGQGVLQEIISPWNEFRLVLVISGLDDEGVLRAGDGLNRQAHFLGMRGPVAIIIDLAPRSSSGIPPFSKMTLASLGYGDEIASGALPKTYNFDFFLPLGWQLEEAPFFTLKFAHSDILDPVTSALDVRLNNVPIASTLLDDSNTEKGELVIALPTHLLETGRNQLRVNITMALPVDPNDPCKHLNDERAWTVISSESELSLPYQVLDMLPDLSLFPYPFSQSLGLEPTVIVLPDQSDSSLFDDLIQLAVRLGSPVSTPDVSIRVAYASEAKEFQQDHHLILLGIPSDNVMLQEANAYLPQPFTPESDFLEPLVIDSVAFLPDPERDAGLLEIIPSPWNPEYNLLALTGTTIEGISLGIQTLLENTRSLKGNLAVVEPSLIANPFSEEPDQVTTYSVDTRPLSSGSNGAESINFTSEKDPLSLGGRWWR
jgi:hypothetical protein